MVRVNSLLRRLRLCRQVGYKLMPREPKHDSVARLPPQRTTKSIDIEALCRRQIVHGKGEMKESSRHCSIQLDYV